MSERLPPPDAARIQQTAPRKSELLVLSSGTMVTRLHTLSGRYPSRWNQFRSYGPTKSRFDHHSSPPRVQSRLVLYAAHGVGAFTAAVAEYFQDESGRGVGPIDRSAGDPTITTFELERPLILLNLNSGWITRAGGNQAICTGPRSRSRQWARAIYSAHPHLEGLAYQSSVWAPGQCIVVWERGLDAVPNAPTATRLLSDPGLDVPLANAARHLQTYLL